MAVDERQDSIEYGASGGLCGQAVEHPSAVWEPLHKAARSQQAQMAGDARLTLIHDLAQLHHREFFAGEQGDDAQARRLAGRAQHFDRLGQTYRHKDIRMSLCPTVKMTP